MFISFHVGVKDIRCVKTTRRTYQFVPEYIKFLPEYTVNREKNLNAVKRYRERSRMNAKLLEDGKERFVCLKRCYDDELQRIESVKKVSCQFLDLF